ALVVLAILACRSAEPPSAPEAQRSPAATERAVPVAPIVEAPVAEPSPAQLLERPPISAVSVVASSWWSSRNRPYAWRATFRKTAACSHTALCFGTRTGACGGRRTDASWDVLEPAIEAADRAADEPSYRSENAGTDGITLHVEIERGDRTRAIDDYERSGPEDLVALEDLLDTLVEKTAWTPRFR